MGKEGELWDDSVLITAFDQAISKYKKMHGKGYKETPNTGAADLNINNSVAPAASNTSGEDTSNPEILDGGNENGLGAVPESLKTSNRNGAADSEVTGEHALESNVLPLQDQSHNYSTSLDVDEYNQLYKQYYEVEEQRQKILQKLQNFSSGQYPYTSEVPVSGSQWGTSSATQEYQSYISQVPCGAMVVSCCPCPSQCSMASCSLPCPLNGVSACNSGVNSSATMDLGKFSAVEDNIVKTAMGAAEKAISALKINASDSKEENKTDSVVEQKATVGTDLSTVLNVWYSAGFYTGKYLTEQCFVKKQHN
ncbi:uncharacterized protein LOC130801278 [Amaranthus tricolor]|uniref:uncharacterized protein LOC130801278 n=1 Tax=Amaranthus tricolor TaxID=29722 RepID=UPI00258291ED|nr:uncharacterized protein LOC130801278 [Amaranthus tricolor]